FQLTKDDLQSTNPYNTYINKGLPPGPIANPGLDSITAAVTPVQSNYLYYLSDMQGNFHFAATYQEFLTYKHKYLGS
ncbi:MAG TPA: endolytic transglycosylase MltG, partial [Candidatus Paceibacterota bacterium]